MPKHIFQGSARLMTWEFHLLDYVVRSPLPLTIADLYSYLLTIYETTQDKITSRDCLRACRYLVSCGFIKFDNGFYSSTDSGVSLALWIDHISKMKLEFFKFLPPFGEDSYNVS
jgi:hypothetical protein